MEIVFFICDFAIFSNSSLIVNTRRTFRRQASDFGRSVLPRPPAEFFEPSDLPEVPSGLKPEVFYISHHLK